MPIPARELKATLSGKLGFKPKGSGRGPHDKFELKVGGRYVAHTQVPRGYRDLDDSLLGRIALQLGVPRRLVYELVACTMDRESYLRHLNETSA